MGFVFNPFTGNLDLVNSSTSRVGFTARNSNTTIPSSSFTVIVFSTEEEDTHNAWNGSRFTAPEAGLYEVFGHGTFASVSDGNRAIIGIHKNGSLTQGGLLGRGVSGGSNLNGYGGAMRLFLDADDYIEMVGWCGNATTMYNASQTGYSTFSCYKMN